MCIVVTGIYIPVTTDAWAQRTQELDIKVDTIIDYCGDKNIVVLINAGEISENDKLNLYEFSIGFDKSKVKFIDVLKSGTLSENLEYVISGIQDTGVVRVSGFNVTKYIKGNKPIIGLLFRYVGVCNQKVYFDNRFTPETNENAKIKFEYSKIGESKLQIVDKPERSLKIEFSNDTIKVGLSELIKSVLIPNVPIGSSTKWLSIKLGLENQFVIDSAKLNDTSKVSLSIKNDILHYVSKVGNLGGSIPTSLYMRWINNTGEPIGITGQIINYDTCACISKAVSDTLYIAREELSSNRDNYSEPPNLIEVIHNSNVWELKSSEDMLRVSVYNVLGTLIRQFDERSYKTLIIDKRNIPNEISFLRIEFVNGKTTTMKLIK
ncbi:MAG: hypothetical protein U0Y96_01285 [Candidatus Kapaibacterium sp.]|nr:hypothetical protein [Bacteroidota bacterium]